MATPDVREQLAPRLLRLAATSAPPPAQWRAQERLDSAPYRPRTASPMSLDAAPMLPRISSLLSAGGVPGGRGPFHPQDTAVEVNSRKRSREMDAKLQPREHFRGLRDEDWAVPPRGFYGRESGPLAASMRRVVYPELGLKRDAVSPADDRAPPEFSCNLAPRGRQAMETERLVMNDETVECRRLYFNRFDPQKTREIRIPAEIPVAPRYHEQLGARKQQRRVSRYHHLQMEMGHVDMEPIYGRDDMEKMAIINQKRRRMEPPSPPSQRREPLYEPQYGLTVLERSKPLMRSRFTVSMPCTTDEEEFASRRRYSRSEPLGTKEVDSPRDSGPRVSYNVRGDIPMATSAPVVRVSSSTLRIHQDPPSVEKCDPQSLTTMVLKSKEFLKSKSLVRNRHDEIDWVATFLNVGFDSSSIYALMCPLRKGRWKVEEENYTMGLLRLIENGTILLRHGQSIRGFIGEKLHSDDMRVLKKLSNCKMFHFTKLINPRLAEEEKIDMEVEGAQEGLGRLEKLKGEFLRSVQLEALVAVRKYLSDSSLRDLLNVRD